MAAESKEYLTIRVDPDFKAKILEIAEAEHRSTSNLCRLLLEYAFGEYQHAGSIRDLLLSEKETANRRR